MSDRHHRVAVLLCLLRDDVLDALCLTLTVVWVASTGYELVEECGKGMSATVWRAIVKSTGEEVAIKNLDLESLTCSIDEIVREVRFCFAGRRASVVR